MDNINMENKKYLKTQQEHAYAIHISGKLLKIEAASVTGRELKQLGDVPEGNDLFLKVPGDSDRGITDDQVVELKNGMHFYDLPPSNLGGELV